MKSRIVILFIGISALWGMLLVRAAWLQFMPNERLQALQDRQFQTVVTLPARRGAIVDRNGRELAMSTAAQSLYADPKMIENRKSAAKLIAKELGVSVETIWPKLRDPSRRFVWIQRQIEPAIAEKIKEYQIKGLGFVEEWKRVYPNDSVLAHTMGMLGAEGQGLEGLELQYDSILKGNQKKVSVRRDARGRPLVAEGLLFTENPEGSELQLTIDSEIQYTLEGELQNALKEFEADSAIGIVLDAKTSAIRAIAQAPSFDVNKAMKVPAEIRRNRAIADSFEPGSTMKTFLLASGMREGKINSESKYFCENGSFKLTDRVIREADSHHSFGWLNVADILKFSSNIGTTKIALQLGDDYVRAGLSQFGFGQKLGIDLPGEAKGTLHPTPWRTHLLANISFGQGVSATPIQVVNAYAAIANGGILNTPYIVQSAKDPESGEVKEVEHKSGVRVVDQKIAQEMTKMLVGVTASDGTGFNARVSGFNVAGKTGTAQKVNPKGRGYLPGAYISSFAGFIPAEDPRFVIYIAVDSAKKAYYGSTVAAPVFARVAGFAVRKDGITPAGVKAGLANAKPAEAKSTHPLAQTTVTELKTAVDILAESATKPLEQVPPMENLTLREVLQKISGKNVNLKVIGSGTVKETIPARGSFINEGDSITVILR